MLATCLDNFIGIRGLKNDVTPESGLYINDLQSVSIKLLANLATEEQKNFKGVYNEITTRALNEFEADVMNKAQKFFKTNVVLENNKSGYYPEPYETEAASAFYKGVSIELRDNISKYLSVYINTAQIYLDSAGTKEIRIYNTLDGKILHSITFEGSVGMNRVAINKSILTYGQNTNLFVCYDGTATASIKTDNIGDSSVAIVQGAKCSTGSSVIDANLDFTGDSAGLVVDYNIKCDLSEFICSNRDAFKFALWYKYGSAIMFDRLDSDRLNKFTLNKTAAEKKELYNFYETKYDESVESVIKSLNTSQDPYCFACNKKRQYKFLRP